MQTWKSTIPSAKRCGRGHKTLSQILYVIRRILVHVMIKPVGKNDLTRGTPSDDRRLLRVIIREIIAGQLRIQPFF